MELIIKAGRRCSYDMRHCADDMHDPAKSKMWHDRATHWLEVFDPVSGPKNYRTTLHIAIVELECIKPL